MIDKENENDDIEPNKTLINEQSKVSTLDDIQEKDIKATEQSMSLLDVNYRT